MDYAALAIEIVKPEYNGMTDAEIAAAINAGTYEVKQDIPTDLAKMSLINTDTLDWGELIGVADGSITPTQPTQPKRKRAITLRELLNTQSPVEVASDDVWWGRISTLLGDLVTDGIISSAGRTAFEALRLRLDPLWKKFGDRSLDFADIAAARNS